MIFCVNIKLFFLEAEYCRGFGIMGLLIFSPSSSHLFWDLKVICGQLSMCNCEAVNSAFFVATAFAPNSSDLFHSVYYCFQAEPGKRMLRTGVLPMRTCSGLDSLAILGRRVWIRKKSDMFFKGMEILRL